MAVIILSIDAWPHHERMSFYPTHACGLLSIDHHTLYFLWLLYDISLLRTSCSHHNHKTSESFAIVPSCFPHFIKVVIFKKMSFIRITIVETNILSFTVKHAALKITFVITAVSILDGPFSVLLPVYHFAMILFAIIPRYLARTMRWGWPSSSTSTMHLTHTPSKSKCHRMSFLLYYTASIATSSDGSSASNSIASSSTVVSTESCD